MWNLRPDPDVPAEGQVKSLVYSEAMWARGGERPQLGTLVPGAAMMGQEPDMSQAVDRTSLP